MRARREREGERGEGEQSGRREGERRSAGRGESGAALVRLLAALRKDAQRPIRKAASRTPARAAPIRGGRTRSPCGSRGIGKESGRRRTSSWSFMAWMAASADDWSAKVTKPKPRERPVPGSLCAARRGGESAREDRRDEAEQAMMRGRAGGARGSSSRCLAARSRGGEGKRTHVMTMQSTIWPNCWNASRSVSLLLRGQRGGKEGQHAILARSGSEEGDEVTHVPLKTTNTMRRRQRRQRRGRRGCDGAS